MSAAPTTVALRLSGVWKRYPGVTALRNVSLEVLGGEVHALLGENGAGKSTLMGVAGGSVKADAGEVEIGGTVLERAAPSLAMRLGLAIVYQHPAVLPDLTVAENMALGVDRALRADGARGTGWMRDALDEVGCAVDLGQRMTDLDVAERHLIEIAKALAIRPSLLVLDEPTAPLGAEASEVVFAQVRAAAARGAAVVYITHRIHEVRRVADRVTVMRDGEVRRVSRVDDISDEEIVTAIVGRTLESAFPAKGRVDAGRPPALTVRGFSNHSFHDIHLHAEQGEIVGIAGIAGNGQSDFLRALAGLAHARGEVVLGGEPLHAKNQQQARAQGVAYVPSDRHHEGLLMGLSLRENATLVALDGLSRAGVVDAREERVAAESQRAKLAIKAPTLETPVSSLSGGNQQKVLLARASLVNPRLLLVDEPTQGVDAGARLEIYRILRDLADHGVPVVLTSSDALELEGLCDRVVVFSRGRVVEELVGDAVTEERIAQSIVTSTSHRADDPSEQRRRRGALRHFVRGDYAPAVVLALVIVALGAYTQAQNERFLSDFNITAALTLFAALAFISIGQTAVLLTGGVDLSVGPMAGFVAVIASFFVLEGKPGATVALGFLLMFLAAIGAGAVNGSLVAWLGYTPVAATLATYIALQGFSFLLRPFQDGYIDPGITSAVKTKIGAVPAAAIAAAVLAILVELALRYTRWGLALRAVGSNPQVAHRLGVRVRLTTAGAYVFCAAFTFLGGVMLMAQVGVGDAAQGVTYTLGSVTAVVLGGTSLLGGRGSFVGALIGAVLLQQLLNATVFLQLSQAWQYWFQGLLVLVAATLFSQARRARAAA